MHTITANVKPFLNVLSFYTLRFNIRAYDKFINGTNSAVANKNTTYCQLVVCAFLFIYLSTGPAWAGG